MIATITKAPWLMVHQGVPKFLIPKRFYRFITGLTIWWAVLLFVTNTRANSPGETPGVPWQGSPGITQSIDQILSVTTESGEDDETMGDDDDVESEKEQKPGLRGGRRRTIPPQSLLHNPVSPAISQWPPPASTSATEPPLTPQVVGTNFLGIQLSEAGFIPPDSMGAVGPSQVMVIANGRIKVFNKDGTAGPLNTTTDNLFNTVRSAGTSDPHVRYDRLSQRWFITMIDVATHNRVLIAVSSGPTISAASSFTFFQFQHDLPGITPNSDTGGFADYDTLGVDKSALYIGINVFNSTRTALLGTTGFVVNKTNLLAGILTVTPFRQIGSANGTGSGPWTPQGVDNDDPNATEGYFIGVDNITFGKLAIRRISNPGGTPSISANLNLTVPATGSPISQAHKGNTVNKNLDALDDRLFGAAIRKNKLTGVASLFTAHNIQVNSSGVASSSGGRNGSRWYEIGNLTSTPVLVQSGTLFDSAASSPRGFWIPSVAVTGQGHMALGCSYASINDFAGIATAGRLRTDPLGTLQPPTLALVSSSAYNLSENGSVHRWGDYSQVAVDPNDDMTVWTFQEYCNSGNSWGVAAIQLKAPLPASPITATPATLLQGQSSVDVAITGLSVSGSEFFDPGSDAGGPGFLSHLGVAIDGGGVIVNNVTFLGPTNFSVNLTVQAGAGLGSRTITVTNPDGQAITSASGILTINSSGVTASFIAGPTSGPVPLNVSFTNLSTGATNYVWDFGDGNTSTNTNPIYTYTNPGTYSVTLTAIGGGETNVLIRNDYISTFFFTNSPPVIVAQPENQIVNIGGTANFSVTATGTQPLAFQWRFQGTNIGGATDSVYSRSNVQLTDAGLYSVSVTNSLGIAVSSNATLAVVLDVIPVTGDPYTQDFDSIGATGTNTPPGWFVGTGTGSISGKEVVVGNGSSNGGANYNFGSTGSNDRALGSLATPSTQRDTEARFVNVSGSLITSFALNYTGEQWRVGGNGSVNNDLVMQYSIDGANFVAMGTQFNFNSPVDSGTASALDGNAAANRVTGIGGIYLPASVITNGQTFYLRWADADNQAADHAMALDDFSITFTLSNPPPPAVVANFDATPTNGVAPLTVTFTNLSTGATNYSWDFGDGNSSTASNPNNTYTNPGNYSVSLTASGPGGTNVLPRINLILVTNPPPPALADFTGAPTSGVAPLIVAFTNLSTGASSYSWDFGDGNGSAVSNPNNTYTNPGNYTVNLTAIGPGGTNTFSRTNFIVVTNPPPPVLADFTGAPTSGVAPLIVTFTNLSTGANSYSWGFGDGNNSTVSNPNNTYTNPGNYTVNLTAIGPGGTNTFSRTNFIVVTNSPPPVVVDFTGAPTSGVAPLIVSFTNFSTGASSYSWDFGDGNGSAVSNPNNTYTNPGNYTVNLTAIGSGGTNTFSRTNFIVVTNPPPPVVVDFTGAPTSGVTPLIVSFTNLSTGASSYSWEFGDGNTSTDTHPGNMYTNPGSYTVSLTAIGAGGTNTFSRTNFILVSNPTSTVVADFTGAPTSGVTPLIVLFTNLSTGASSYSWDFGDGNTSTNTHPGNMYTNPGSYTVSLTATGADGTNILSRTNYVTVFAPPQLVVSSAGLDFGSVFTNTIGQGSFVISNAGGIQLNGTAELNEDPFHLLDANSNLVSNFAFTVPALSSTNILFEFAPTMPGPFSNIVVFVTDGGVSTNALTGIGATAPLLLAAHEGGGTNLLLTFETISGKLYLIQYKDFINDATWHLLETVPGDGLLKIRPTPISTAAQRFFRLSVE